MKLVCGRTEVSVHFCPCVTISASCPRQDHVSEALVTNQLAADTDAAADVHCRKMYSRLWEICSQVTPRKKLITIWILV